MTDTSATREPLTCPHGVGKCVCRICTAIDKAFESKTPTPNRGEDTPWTDEAVRLLDLYVRGFVPIDVARELVGKYRALPENEGRNIFNSNPAYTDAQLLAFQKERGEDKLPELDVSPEEEAIAKGNYPDRPHLKGFHHDLQCLRQRELCRERQLLAALKENAFQKLLMDEMRELHYSETMLIVGRAEQAEAKLAAYRIPDEEILNLRAALAERDEEIARLTKNRDEWERNSAIENKRAGDLEVKMRNLKSELARLKGE